MSKIDDGEIKLEVMVYRRPHMRDHNLEFELQIGRNILDNLFDNMKMMPEVTDVFFSFPENWLNIVEQRVLFHRLEHYCPNLKSIKIKTQSVYIIQCTKSQNVKIISSEYESLNGLAQETLSNGEINLTEKMFAPMVGSLFNVNKLNVI